jgi:hypothetical protein
MALDIATDELNDLPPVATSERISKVPGGSEEPEDDYIDAEEAEGSSKVVEADEQALKLHEECKKFGQRFRSLCSEFDEYAPFVIAMKKKFGVKMGFAGHKLRLPDFPEGIYWSTYCDEVFDLTPRRVNQLINHTDEKPENVRRQRPIEEHPAYLKGKAAGRLERDNELLAKGVDKESKTLEEIVADEEPEPKSPQFDRQNPYAYWTELDKDAPVLAQEVLAMLEEIGLDSQQIGQVIEQMKKQHKPSTTPLKTRFTAVAAA